MGAVEQAAQKILTALARRSPQKARWTVAIDGRCTSGKTTLAAYLAQKVGAQVIRADDFFLRPEQRSLARRQAPGENVDWERLIEEVLAPLSRGKGFSYRPFDCHTLDFKSAVSGGPCALTVLEGTYSCNTHLWAYSDFHVFLDISPQTQSQRLRARNGVEGAKRFQDLWVPLEERYFDTFDLRNRCNLYLNMEPRP